MGAARCGTTTSSIGTARLWTPAWQAARRAVGWSRAASRRAALPERRQSQAADSEERYPVRAVTCPVARPALFRLAARSACPTTAATPAVAAVVSSVRRANTRRPRCSRWLRSRSTSHGGAPARRALLRVILRPGTARPFFFRAPDSWPGFRAPRRASPRFRARSLCRGHHRAAERAPRSPS